MAQLLGELALGPVLHAGLSDQATWRFYVNVLIRTGEKDPNLGCPLVVGVSATGVTVTGPELQADLRPEGAPYMAWRWHVEVPREPTDRWIAYEFEAAGGWTLSKIIGRAHDLEASLQPTGAELVEGVCVPALGCLPRIAAHSCSWFSDPSTPVNSQQAYGRWVGLYQRHTRARTERLTELPGGFHLQVGGGDQIYADALLKHDFYDQLWNLPNATLPPNANERALDRYLELYATRWSAPAMAKVMARIPGVFTWDDHEIMDGWGSYSDDLQTAPGRQVIWRAARRAFEVVQLGGRADFRYPPITGWALPRGLPVPSRRAAANGPAVDPHYLQSLSFKEDAVELHLLLLDLRSERSMDRVMAAEWQWRDLENWLQGFERAASQPERQGRKRHLLVVSSIPPLFLSAAGVPEVLLRGVPGAQEFEDDLRDQWECGAHQTERQRLLQRLFLTAERVACRVTIVSGDIHVGAHAEITNGAGPGPNGLIHQLVSSGMVHPAPGWVAQLAVRLAGRLQGRTSFGGGISGKLVPLDGSTFLTDENYLQLVFDDPQPGNPQSRSGRMHVLWVTDGGPLRNAALTIAPGDAGTAPLAIPT